MKKQIPTLFLEKTIFSGLISCSKNVFFIYFQRIRFFAQFTTSLCLFETISITMLGEQHLPKSHVFIFRQMSVLITFSECFQNVLRNIFENVFENVFQHIEFGKISTVKLVIETLLFISTYCGIGKKCNKNTFSIWKMVLGAVFPHALGTDIAVHSRFCRSVKKQFNFLVKIFIIT